MNTPDQHSSPRPPLLPVGPLGWGVALAGYLTYLVAIGLATGFSLAVFTSGGADLSYFGLPFQMLTMFLLGALVLRLTRRRAYQPDDLGLSMPAG